MTTAPRGNHPPPPTDYRIVMCADIQTALSARLDGEEQGLPDGLIDTHLIGCAFCRDWQESARRMTRVVRAMGAGVEPPDLIGSIMRAVEADSRPVARANLLWALGRVTRSGTADASLAATE